jgi:putative membrane protein
MQTLSGERVIWQGSPSWKALLLYYIKWTLVSLVPVAVWVVLDQVMGDPPSLMWFLVATLVGLALTYIVGWIRRATTRYRVTDRRIQIRTGLISRNESSANLGRVQNVNVTQSAFQRMLGIGNVDWDTAGAEVGDADFTFRGVEDPSRLVHLVDSSLEGQDDPSGRNPIGL